VDEAFTKEMSDGYALSEPGIVLGNPMLGGEIAPTHVQVALSMMNRHGLVAGATGTGKTKTLQVMAGQLSAQGVPCFVADVKGDLTGLAAPGDATNPKVQERVTQLGWNFQPAGHPVQFLSLSGKLGAQVRATVHSFGPMLLGRVLGLNDTQTSVLAMVFKYCDDGALPLLDLADLTTTLKYLGSDQQPALFSTFMLWMLAQLYGALPEVGDLPKPKLCFFFDEAHLLFDDASAALLQEIERTARLIRSKGVGVYFVTQTPTDVASSVLAQLGNRVQHALRVFTPQDADALKKTVETFPMTDHFDVGKTLTSLGIGEALVTVLSPNGVPTPLAPTRLIPPDSLMAAIPAADFQARVASGPLTAKYAQTVDRQSAHEMIQAKIAAAQQAAAPAPVQSGVGAGAGAGAGAGTPAPRPGAKPAGGRPGGGRRPPAPTSPASKKPLDVNVLIREGTKIATSRTGQEVARTVFGALFGKKS
jgi:DNA helicase HerA-like ATPase